MKNTTTTLFYFLFIALLFSACKKEEEVIPDEDINIDLITLNLVIFEKTMILYEDENYLVKTPLQFFIGGLGDYYFSNYNKFLSTIDSIASDGEKSNTLLTSNYFESDVTDYVCAHFLESGNCLIYDKINDRVIPTIKMEKFDCDEKPFGLDGRRFYIYNKLFLELIDAICN